MPYNYDVTFLVRSLGRGGAEYQLALLAQHMRKAGRKVNIVAFYPGIWDMQVRQSGVSLNVVGKSSRYDVIRFLYRLLKATLISRPRVLHGYMDTANILAVVMKIFLPRTRIVWGIRGAEKNLKVYDFLRAVLFRMEGLLRRFPDMTIVNSEVGKDFLLKRGFDSKKVEVIQNGIDVQRFIPSPTLRRAMRDKLGVKDGTILIGVVGRRCAEKDYPTLFKAVSILHQKRNDLKLVMVGVGHFDEFISPEFPVDRDRVMVISSHERIEEFYPALDVMVSSSNSEGFPNVLAEAMACGVPCVATDAGDSRIIVGAFGKMVKVGDYVDLAKAIDTLATSKDIDPALTRQHIKDCFSIETLINRTDGVLFHNNRTQELCPRTNPLW